MVANRRRPFLATMIPKSSQLSAIAISFRAAPPEGPGGFRSGGVWLNPGSCTLKVYRHDRILEIRGVGCRLGGRTVLHDIDLTVEAGETVVLLGRSGSGKTTLLKTV